MVVKHSPLAEFLDNSEPKICLLDDNFFGYSDWKIALQELIDTGKHFTFKRLYDDNFWQNDLIGLFRRIEILLAHKVKPFVMKHADYLKSPYRNFIHALRVGLISRNFFGKFLLKIFATPKIIFCRVSSSLTKNIF